MNSQPPKKSNANQPNANQPNANQQFLKLAADVLSELDIRYMQADLDQQLELRDELDQAMLNYSRARLAILKQQVICTPKDVEKMRELRQKLARSQGWNQVLDSALGFAGFLASRFIF